MWFAEVHSRSEEAQHEADGTGKGAALAGEAKGRDRRVRARGLLVGLRLVHDNASFQRLGKVLGKVKAVTEATAFELWRLNGGLDGT